MANGRVAREQFEQARLGRRAMPEILPHGVGERLFVVEQQPIEGTQTTRAHRPIRIRIVSGGTLQAGKAARQRIGMGHALLLVEVVPG